MPLVAKVSSSQAGCRAPAVTSFPYRLPLPDLWHLRNDCLQLGSGNHCDTIKVSDQDVTGIRCLHLPRRRAVRPHPVRSSSKNSGGQTTCKYRDTGGLDSADITNNTVCQNGNAPAVLRHGNKVITNDRVSHVFSGRDDKTSPGRATSSAAQTARLSRGPA